MRYCANVWVTVNDENPPHENDIKDYLHGAVDISIDTDHYGDGGVESIEIDWDSLRAG